MKAVRKNEDFWIPSPPLQLFRSKWCEGRIILMATRPSSFMSSRRPVDPILHWRNDRGNDTNKESFFFPSFSFGRGHVMEIIVLWSCGQCNRHKQTHAGCAWSWCLEGCVLSFIVALLRLFCLLRRFNEQKCRKVKIYVLTTASCPDYNIKNDAQICRTTVAQFPKRGRIT